MSVLVLGGCTIHTGSHVNYPERESKPPPAAPAANASATPTQSETSGASTPAEPDAPEATHPGSSVAAAAEHVRSDKEPAAEAARKDEEARRAEEARKKQEREDKLAAEKAEAERKKQERADAAEQKKKEREDKLAAEKAEAERKKQERADAAEQKKKEREQAGKEATAVKPVVPMRPAAQIAAQTQGNAAARTEQLQTGESGKKGVRKPASDKEAQVEQLDPHVLREARVKETEKPQGAPSDRNATTVKKKAQAGAAPTKADQVERLANSQSERTGGSTTTKQTKPNPDVNRVEQLK